MMYSLDAVSSGIRNGTNSPSEVKQSPGFPKPAVFYIGNIVLRIRPETIERLKQCRSDSVSDFATTQLGTKIKTPLPSESLQYPGKQGKFSLKSVPWIYDSTNSKREKWQIYVSGVEGSFMKEILIAVDSSGSVLIEAKCQGNQVHAENYFRALEIAFDSTSNVAKAEGSKQLQTLYRIILENNEIPQLLNKLISDLLEKGKNH